MLIKTPVALLIINLFVIFICGSVKLFERKFHVNCSNALSSNNRVVGVDFLSDDEVFFGKSSFDLNHAIRTLFDAHFFVANQISS